jgi:hypothetical protein
LTRQILKRISNKPKALKNKALMQIIQEERSKDSLFFFVVYYTVFICFGALSSIKKGHK